MIESELLSIRMVLVKVTLKLIKRNIYYWFYLSKLILGLVNVFNINLIGTFYEKELLLSKL